MIRNLIGNAIFRTLGADSIITLKKSSLIFSFLMLAMLQSARCAPKIDTIYFQTGDRITGEVLALENNQLKLSTEDAGIIRVEWNKVDSVKILNNMRIVLDQGKILYGKMLPAGEVGTCYIWSREEEPELMELIHIVSLSLMEDKFLNRLNGSLSSGFSYVKASQVMQMSINGSLEYEAEKNRLQLSYDGIFTNDPESGSTQRQDGGAMFMRLLPKNWFLVSSLSAETNSELELDLRTSLSMGGGNSLVHTNFSRLHIALGLQVSRESSSGENQNNVEGLLLTTYSVFIYDDPEVSFSLSGKLIPSLTTLGRVRTDIDSSLKWEVFNDLYLKWTFYYNFDSQPLSGSTEKSDWAVTLIGVEYRL
jgi:hypothetical protein